MELYIRIKDGQPFEHPILGDNFRQAFPDVDTENLPPEFARFVRVPEPVLGVFDLCTGCEYKFVDGVYTDVHNVRPMTDEERAEKTAQATNALRPGWTLNPETLQPIPPPRPTTSGPWRFNTQAGEWQVNTTPPFPSWTVSADGTRFQAPIPRPEGRYRWDEPTLSWIALSE